MDSESVPSSGSSGYGNQNPQPFSPDLLRITDFGLAKKLATEIHLTQTKAILGTPSYMAPEQATSTKQAGPQADIWAIGVMLYEMITGSLPFVGADSVEVMDNLRVKDPVPLSEKVKVPKDLETICLKCLRKDPLDRYASAQILAEDLRAFQEGRSISARPMSKLEKGIRWVRRNPTPTILVTITGLSLILGAVISLFYASEAKENASKFEKAANAEKERTTELQNALIDVRDSNKKLDKQYQDLETAQDSLKKMLGRSEHLNANSNILLAASAENGKLIRDFLEKVPLKHRKWEWHYLKNQNQGGLFPLFGHSSSVSSVHWSPDGTRIVSGGEDYTLRIWNTKTGQSLAELRGHTSPVRSVSWSPDGSRIVSGGLDQTVRIWNARTGQSILEVKGFSKAVHEVYWNSDGSKVISREYQGKRLFWDVRSGKSDPHANIPAKQNANNIDSTNKRIAIGRGKSIWMIDLEISKEEILRRQWKMQLDPDWHSQQMIQSVLESDSIRYAHHRYWYLRSKAEVAFRNSQFDESFALSVKAASLKGHLTQSPELLPKIEDLVTQTRIFVSQSENYFQQGRVEQGLKELTRAIQLNPLNVVLIHRRGVRLYQAGKYAEADADFQTEIELRNQEFRLDPKNDTKLNNIAWFLAVCPSAKFRNGPKALELATQICEKNQWKKALWLDTLAGAYAECGKFDEAVRWQQKAIDIPYGLSTKDQKEAIERLKLYQQKKPYRE